LVKHTDPLSTLASVIKVGILTISDTSSSNPKADRSGPLLQDIITAAGWNVASTEITSDDPKAIARSILKLTDIEELDVVITSGGTGFGVRDNTPEVGLRRGRQSYNVV
jgi:gephyrin